VDEIEELRAGVARQGWFNTIDLLGRVSPRSRPSGVAPTACPAPSSRRLGYPPVGATASGDSYSGGDDT